MNITKKIDSLVEEKSKVLWPGTPEYKKKFPKESKPGQRYQPQDYGKRGYKPEKDEDEKEVKEDFNLDEVHDINHHRAELQKTNDKIEAITKQGGRVGLNDPLSAKVKYHAAQIKKLKSTTNEEVDLNEESLTAGKRLISKHGEGSHTARVYKDTEYNEYQVHHFKDGKHMGEGPISYHDDKEDAENTARMSLRKRMKEEVELKEIYSFPEPTSLVGKAAMHTIGAVAVGAIALHQAFPSREKKPPLDHNIDKAYENKDHKLYHSLLAHKHTLLAKHYNGQAEHVTNSPSSYYKKDGQKGKKGEMKPSSRVNALYARQNAEHHEKKAAEYSEKEKSGARIDESFDMEQIDEAKGLAGMSLDQLKQEHDKVQNKIQAQGVSKMISMNHPLSQRARAIRLHMMIKKKQANEEVEPIDELKKSTLASYAKKASHDARIKMATGKDFERISRTSKKPAYKAAASDWEQRYKSDARRREAGVNRAIDKLAKEEVEQVDELKKSTLGSYINKASVDMANRTAEGERKRTLAGADYAHNISRGMSAKTAEAGMKKDYDAAKPDVKKAVKRMYGINRAVDRLTK